MIRAAAAVALSAALILGLAQLETPWHLLGLVCLVPFLSALERVRSGRAALWLGVAMSVGYSIAALGWFPGAVARYTGVPAWTMSALLVVAAPLLQPQYPAFALTRWALARRNVDPALTALGGALALVGVEAVAPRLFDTTLGYGLYPSETIRQAADVAGVRGLTLVLVLANEALWALWRDRAELKRRAVLLRVVALALPLAVATAYGAVRLSSLSVPSAEKPLRIGVVQSNLTRYGELAERLGTYDAARTILDTHYALSRELLSRAPGGELPAELVVWPETAYPTTFGAPKSEAGAELDAELRSFTSSAGVPLLFGAYASEGTREYNAAVLLSPEAHAATQTYRKVRPFPLTEYVPPMIDGPRLRALLPWLGTWSPGPGAALLTLARADGRPVRLMPLICYDITAAELVAEATRQGADAIVSIANDAWFVGTAGAKQHLIVSAFRSIEMRLPQVRATTSGISAEIDPLGRITHRTDEDRAQVLRASFVPGARAVTLAARWGDWFGVTAFTLAALTLVAARVWRRA